MPNGMQVRPQSLLHEKFLAERAAEIDIGKAKFYQSGLPAYKGTVYLTAADRSAMMVSFIQSNFYGFGSAVAITGTGISMRNRALGFSLEPGHLITIRKFKR